MAASPSLDVIAGYGAAAARWRDDPVAYVVQAYERDPEGYAVAVDAPQARILNAVAKHDRVAVRSSHGIGKTTTASWLTHWWLATRYPALVVTLAGTWNHLEDKLWPELKTWGRTWKLRDAFEQQEMGLYGRSSPDNWRAEASASDKPENVEGWHNPNLLVLIDEAKAMPDGMYEAIRGALTQTSRDGTRPKLVVLSTPPLARVGWYASLFGPSASGWERIHVSGHDSPRVSKDWIAEMEHDFGPGSAVYQSKVLGEIPEGSSESVIELRWIEQAQARKAGNDNKRAVITCDVAREGEDLSVIARIWQGKHEILWWRATSELMEVAGACKRLCEDHDAKMLCLDDTGIGGGVTDRLIELQRSSPAQFPLRCQIVPVKFGGSAVRKDRYHDAKSERWWATRDALRAGKLALQTDHELAALGLPRHSSLVEQLATPIYEEDSLARVRVYDKRSGANEKTKALPAKSPDLGHSLILGVPEYLRMEAEGPPPPKTLEELRARQHEDAWKKLIEGEPDVPTGRGGMRW